MCYVQYLLLKVTKIFQRKIATVVFTHHISALLKPSHMGAANMQIIGKNCDV